MPAIRADDRHQPQFFKDAWDVLPSWQTILNALNKELDLNRARKFMHHAFGLYYVDYMDEVNELKAAMAQKHPEDPGVDCHIYISLLRQATGLGKHKDDQSVYSFQAQGETIWKVFPDPLSAKSIDYHLTPGDAVYVPKGMAHQVVSLCPRAGLGVGILNPGQQEFP